MSVCGRFVGERFVDNPEGDDPLPSCEACYKGSSKLIKSLFRCAAAALAAAALCCVDTIHRRRASDTH